MFSPLGHGVSECTGVGHPPPLHCVTNTAAPSPRHGLCTRRVRDFRRTVTDPAALRTRSPYQGQAQGAAGATAGATITAVAAPLATILSGVPLPPEYRPSPTSDPRVSLRRLVEMAERAPDAQGSAPEEGPVVQAQPSITGGHAARQLTRLGPGALAAAAGDGAGGLAGAGAAQERPLLPTQASLRPPPNLSTSGGASQGNATPGDDAGGTEGFSGLSAAHDLLGFLNGQFEDGHTSLRTNASSRAPSLLRSLLSRAGTGRPSGSGWLPRIGKEQDPGLSPSLSHSSFVAAAGGDAADSGTQANTHGAHDRGRESSQVSAGLLSLLGTSTAGNHTAAGAAAGVSSSVPRAPSTLSGVPGEEAAAVCKSWQEWARCGARGAGSMRSLGRSMARGRQLSPRQRAACWNSSFTTSLASPPLP